MSKPKPEYIYKFNNIIDKSEYDSLFFVRRYRAVDEKFLNEGSYRSLSLSFLYYLLLWPQIGAVATYRRLRNSLNHHI